MIEVIICKHFHNFSRTLPQSLRPRNSRWLSGSQIRNHSVTSFSLIFYSIFILRVNINIMLLYIDLFRHSLFGCSNHISASVPSKPFDVTFIFVGVMGISNGSLYSIHAVELFSVSGSTELNRWLSVFNQSSRESHVIRFSQ